MRAAAIVSGFFFVLVAYVVHLTSLLTGLELPPVVAPLGYFMAWLYLASLPLLFGWRTRLFRYVLQEHWTWLAVWLGLPIDYFIVHFHFQRWSWIPVVFGVMLLLGWLLRPWRDGRFVQELHHRRDLWERLLPLGILDLVTLNFWSMRPET